MIQYITISVTMFVMGMLAMGVLASSKNGEMREHVYFYRRVLQQLRKIKPKVYGVEADIFSEVMKYEKENLL